MSETPSCGFKGCLNVGSHTFDFPSGRALACDEHAPRAAQLLIEAREDLNLDVTTGIPVEQPARRARTDVHRPSEIVPEDYVYVGVEHVKIENLGDVYFAQDQRRNIEAHMARTGGNYSHHAHGGNCMVCGNAFAHYTVLFYHPKSNSYVRMGQDCAEKVDCMNTEAFRALTLLKDGVAAARQLKAGKAKAQQILNDLGLSKAFVIYSAGPSASKSQEEDTVFNIVSKLVTYGSLSDKQVDFVHTLLDRIERRPEIEAQRAAERAAAADVPVTDKRVTVRGTIITKKNQEGFRGQVVTKILVKTEAGYKLWGTLPSAIEGYAARMVDDVLRPAFAGAQVGDVVEFNARIERSKDDPKFGFFSRPTQAEIVEAKAKGVTN